MHVRAESFALGYGFNTACGRREINSLSTSLLGNEMHLDLGTSGVGGGVDLASLHSSSSLGKQRNLVHSSSSTSTGIGGEPPSGFYASGVQNGGATPNDHMMRSAYRRRHGFKFKRMPDPPDPLEADIGMLRMRALGSLRSEREEGEIIEDGTAPCPPTESHASSLRPRRLPTCGYPPGECPLLTNNGRASSQKRFKGNASGATATDAARHAFGSRRQLNPRRSSPSVAFVAKLDALVEQIAASSLAIKRLCSELADNCGVPASKRPSPTAEIMDLLQSAAVRISHLESDIHVCRQACTSQGKQRVPEEDPHAGKKVCSVYYLSSPSRRLQGLREQSTQAHPPATAFGRMLRRSSHFPIRSSNTTLLWFLLKTCAFRRFFFSTRRNRASYRPLSTTTSIPLSRCARGSWRASEAAPMRNASISIAAR